MECKEVRPLLDADLDRELPALEALRVQQHVDGCAACREARDALAALASTVRRGGHYYRAPEALRARIVAMLPGEAHAQTRVPMPAAVAGADEQRERRVERDGRPASGGHEDDGARVGGEAGYGDAGVGGGTSNGASHDGSGVGAAIMGGAGNGARARPPSRGPLSWLAEVFRPSDAAGARAGRGGLAAGAGAAGWSSAGAAAAVSRGSLLAGVGLLLVAAVATTVLLVRRPTESGLFVNELVASHVRAELSGRDIDVVSTDQHTVKPWFNGRLDYAPPVEDLAASGFALTGGRLDYVGHRRVAVLIYRYRKHVIDVYVLPTSEAAKRGESAPLATQSDGYAVRRWQAAGMTWWAVSDAESSVLAGFQAVLAARLGGGA
ncbi:anti-sigma factor family protein [Paraburkholderia kururiensis]|uniref:anti-sigma factor family protein n=1 Tax=Paraburkholderia kururiensis TaxID=984307 RepID=UPI000F8618A6|nr:zf-HC2 domain-containing protein [Paraburkholderia kururiensis]